MQSWRYFHCVHGNYIQFDWDFYKLNSRSTSYSTAKSTIIFQMSYVWKNNQTTSLHCTTTPPPSLFSPPLCRPCHLAPPPPPCPPLWERGFCQHITIRVADGGFKWLLSRSCHHPTLTGLLELSVSYWFLCLCCVPSHPHTHTHTHWQPHKHLAT